MPTQGSKCRCQAAPIFSGFSSTNDNCPYSLSDAAHAKPAGPAPTLIISESVIDSPQSTNNLAGTYHEP